MFFTLKFFFENSLFCGSVMLMPEVETSNSTRWGMVEWVGDDFRMASCCKEEEGLRH